MNATPPQARVQQAEQLAQALRKCSQSFLTSPLAAALARNSINSINEMSPQPTVSLLSQSLPVRAPLAIPAEKSLLSVLCDLVKLRLTSLVLLTTLVGFYMASQEAMDYQLMFQTLMGTALVACGASALNQLWEQEYDAKMHRTQDRPLPSGRLQPTTVLLFGITCSVLGLLELALAVNLLTCFLGATTLVVYLFIYTPMKRITWLNTLIGAVPGALPPLMGWTAAQNQLSSGGWSLFAILFFWQIAHFLAIAWLYRDEYAKAGFKMLPVVDPHGRSTGRVAIIHCLGLLLVSLLPVAFELAGAFYLAGALLLGVFFMWFTIQFARKLTLRSARHAFYVSIFYLPMLLLLLSLTKNQ